MATETSTTNTSASPETGGTGTGGPAPIERMFADVAGRDGEKPHPKEQPLQRRSEREPNRQADTYQETDEREPPEEDLDDLSVDGEKPTKEKDNGEPDENEEQDGDEPDDDPEFDLDDQGTKVKLSELRNGYQRQADYTRKTTELSEDRQVVYSYAQEMKAERDTLIGAARELNALALALQPTKEMWEELKKNPSQYIAAQETWKEVEQKRQQIIKTATDALQSEQNQNARQQALFTQEENRKLKELMPAIFDPVKGPKIQERIFKYGERIGYTREELQGAVDHREILTLWKAMRYDEIKGETPNLGKASRSGKAAPAPVQGARTPERQAQPARGIVKQQADRKNRRIEAEKALRRSGSVEDAAMVFSNL